MNHPNSKFEIQENQYHFPYHYIPHLDEHQNVVNHRSLNWGFKYFTYLLRIKAIVEELKASSILDVGCGEGRFLGLLSNNIEKKVGIDLAERPIQFAKAFHPEINFHVKDALEINEEFDVVTAIEVLEHVPDENITNFFRTLEERTRKNGHLIISIPTVVVPVSTKHYRHYNIELFKQQLKKSGANLTIQKVEYAYKSSRFLKLYSKLTQNKLWIIEIKPLRNFVWKLVQSKYSKANENNGEEMIVVLKK